MTAQYTRLPVDDSDSVKLDFSSHFTYEDRQTASENFKSIFTYSDKHARMKEDVRFSVVKQSFSSRLCGHFVTGLSLLLCLLTFPISAWKSFKIVPENERLVVFRLGRLQGTKGPGIVFVIPCIDTCKKVDVRIKAFNVPPLQVITQDGGIAELGADVYYRICDVLRCVTSVHDLNVSIRALVRNTLMNQVVKCDVDDIELKKATIVDAVLNDCNKTVAGWGAEISRIEISPIKVLVKARTDLASGLGGQLPSAFQQIAQAFMSNSGPSPSQPSFHTVELGPDPPGVGAVGCEDVRLVPSMTARDLVTLVRGVLSETLVRSIGTTYQFNLSGDNGGVFYLDLSHGSGSAGEGPDPSGNPDVTLDLSVRNMEQMITGKLNPLQGYMSGILKISGDLSSALRLEDVLNKVISTANRSTTGTVLNI